MSDFSRSVQKLIQIAKDLEMTLEEARAALKRAEQSIIITPRK